MFTNGALELAPQDRAGFETAGIRVATAPVARLVGDKRLEAVELATGERVACDALFTQPPQRQIELVRALGVALDDDGYVKVDPMKRETSIPGIYAAGDLDDPRAGRDPGRGVGHAGRRCAQRRAHGAARARTRALVPAYSLRS